MSDALVGGAVIVGGIVAAFSPFFIKPILAKAKILDVPNERSSHTKPTLRGCGIAQLLGVIVTVAGLILAFGWRIDGRVVFCVSIGAVVASVTGLIDDIRGADGLSTRLRLLIQVCIGTGVSVAVAYFFPQHWWMVVIGSVFIVGYINVVNFMDGINGISGLHGLVVGVSYAVIGSLTGHQWLLAIGLMIAVTFVVFLPWNFAPPGAFLGDVGSYLLGALISGVTVAAIFAGVSWMAMIGPLVIYMADTGGTLIGRLLRKKNIFSAHRDHVYQQLVDQGMSHITSASIVAGCSLVSSALGTLAGLASARQLPIACVVFIMVICYFSLPRLHLLFSHMRI